MVNTGDGKGKTTAALGLAFRHLGSGGKVSIVQFIKGGWVPSEYKAAEAFPDSLKMVSYGKGFVRTSNPKELEIHKAAAAEALDAAERDIVSGEYTLVILDEVNYATSLGLLDIEALMQVLSKKSDAVHVCATGRNAHPLLLEAADTVTEMVCIKHHFDNGISAQKGIEY